MSYGVSGLVSGIDTAAIVDQLVAASARSRTLLQARRTALESRQDAYSTLATNLSSLQSALDAVATVDGFRGVSASSASATDVGVTADGDAVVGRFDVSVDRLASASMHVSSGVGARDTAGVLATGTLAVTVGGTTTAVTIDADTSLDDLVDTINAEVDGVTAYVMETGDATDPYRLVVAGDDTGAANGVSLDTSALDPGTGTVPSFTEVTAAGDAQVEINGVVVTDEDNDIDGAVQGVTFHAYAVTTGSVGVTVARDDDAMVEKLQSVVDAWNAVVAQIAEEREWDADAGTGGAFVGESEPRSVTQRLQTALSARYGDGALAALSSLGIASNEDGELELDTDALEAALADDFSGVVSLVSGEEGVASALSSVIDGMIDADDGTITARTTSLEEQVETMTERIEAYQERLDAYRERLEAQFTAMELAMARFQTAGSALAALLPSTEEE